MHNGFLHSMVLTMAGQKKPGSEEPNPIRKNSIEPEPKLIKYPNGFKNFGI